MESPDLVAPVLLLAMPQVRDPFFRRSVVLLVAHEDGGSLGFIVNRSTDLKVADVVKDLSLAWPGAGEEQALFGGPVQPQVGTVLFSADTDAGTEGSTEVVPGLRLSQHVTVLAELLKQPPRRFRLLLGYAGWGTGQLLSEIRRNDWLTAPVDPDLVFAEALEEVWERGVRSVGVDPATLPAWTSGADAGAN